MRTLAGFVLAAAVVSSCASTTEDVGSDTSNVREYQPSGDESEPVLETVNGFDANGFEYWPYKEEEPIYPSKVQWGFEGGSEPAQLCMSAAYTALMEILQDPPAELLELRQRFGISSFFNWNNDMTGADEGVEPAYPDIWLYQGSLIKWISQTERDGSCLIHEREDLATFAQSCLDDPASCGIDE